MVDEQEDYSKTNPSKSLLKKKSDFCPPPSISPNAAALLKLVNNDLEKLKLKAKGSTNLNEKEFEALKLLADNNQITIKPSDKGGNVVILNNEDYINICNKILNNHNWYHHIPADIIEKYNKEFYVLIDTAILTQY